MDATQIQRRVLTQGLRIEPEMSLHIVRSMAAKPGPIEVIGGDARTGVAVRRSIDPAALLAADEQAPASAS